jgi:ABC-type nitrate/sulfonate/bicarbonate transport system permease component
MSKPSADSIYKGVIRMLPALATVIVIGIAWEYIVRRNSVAPGILPSPTKIAATFWADRVMFLDNLKVTLVEMALGLVLGVTAGVAVSIVITHWRFAEKAIYPLVVTSQMVPFVALAPLLVIWLGFGIAPKVVIVGIGIFFPITVNMVAGLRSADPALIDLMNTFSASRFDILRMVELPASLPYLSSALQLAATYSVITAVVAEWPGSQAGIGRVMITSSALARTDRVLAAVFLITLVSLSLYVLARWSRRALMPWERVGRTG